MSKPDRLEVLGKVSMLIEQIFDAQHLACAELGEEEFISIYFDPAMLEKLYSDLNSLLRKIEKIQYFCEGAQE